MAVGGFSRRSGRWRLTVAGERYAQAPSTSARRAGVVPALVREPCRRRSPVQDSEGSSPTHGSRALGVSTRGRSPRAATLMTAPVHGTPRHAWRAATTGLKCPEVTCSWSACARRAKRSVCALTARLSSGKTRGWAGGGQPTAESPRRWAGPHVARPVYRMSCRSQHARR
jgi:hypothetical protein